MIVISSGWGVQSMCMQGMVAFGELEPITAAIHADTGHERQATYEFAARWTPWLEDHGVHIVTVSNPTPRITTDRQGGKSGYPRLRMTQITMSTANSAANAHTAGRCNRSASGYKPIDMASKSNSG